MNYFLQHWKGQQSLKRSFWINFVLGLILIYLIEYLLESIIHPHSSMFAPVVIAYFVIFHVVLFVWQAVGTLRACDKNISQYMATGWTRAAQFGVIVGFAAVLIWGITLGQSLQRLKLEQQLKSNAQQRPPSYQLNIISNNLTLTGLLSQGITREVKKLIKQHAHIDTVTLNSKGGNIYEARGLAKLIRESGIHTHVNIACYSACTTVFISGIKRTASPQAVFGFHEYKIDTNKLLHSSVNTEREQNRDIQFFLQQGTDEAFIRKAFSTPFENTWFPSHAELIRAGVIQEIVKTQP